MLALALALSLAQTDAPLVAPPPPPSVEDRLTPKQRLRAERKQLVDSLPTRTGPAALTMVSGMALLVGVIVAATGAPALTSNCCGTPVIFAIGTAVAIAGAIGLGGGFLWIHERNLTNQPTTDRIEEIDKELGE